jgi:hypothetical protein
MMDTSALVAFGQSARVATDLLAPWSSADALIPKTTSVHQIALALGCRSTSLLA